MIDAAGIGRIKNLPMNDFTVLLHLDRQIAFRNLHAGGAIAVNPHCTKMNDVAVDAGLDDGGEKIVGGIEIVVDRVTLVIRRLHRMGRRALYGEVHDSVGPPLNNERQKAMIILGDVEVVKGSNLAGYLFPSPNTFSDRPDWRERRCL